LANIPLDHRGRIGFIGLGQIGLPMAQRIRAAGADLQVHDLHADLAAPLLAAGATWCADPAVLAAGCDVILACLPSVDAYHAVADALARAPRTDRGRVYIHLGTTGAQCVRAVAAQLAAVGITTIDAPITGGPPRARAGTLTTMAAGARDAFERVLPIMECYSGKVVWLHADPGGAQIMKSINGMASRTNLLIGCEAVVMGAKAGLDPRLVLEVLNSGTGQNDATLHKIPAALAGGEFGAGMYIVGKDLGIWREDVDALGLPSRVGRAVEAVISEVLAAAAPGDDYLKILEYIEAWSGVRVPRQLD